MRARDDGGVDAIHVGGDEIDQWIDGWLTRAFEWDNDGHLSHSPIGRNGQKRYDYDKTEVVSRIYRFVRAGPLAPPHRHGLVERGGDFAMSFMAFRSFALPAVRRS